jgi:hypothetical protein
VKPFFYLTTPLLWEEDYSVRTYLSDLKLIGADPETISSYLVQHLSGEKFFIG